MMLLTFMSARQCDKHGRRRIILIGFALGVPWSFAVLPLLDTGSPVLFAVGIAGTLVILGMSYGPMASFIPDTFETRFRYTGAGLSFNLAGILGGAVPPLVAGALLASLGPWAIGLMLAVLVGIRFLSTYVLPETMGNRSEHFRCAKARRGPIRDQAIGDAVASDDRLTVITACDNADESSADTYWQTPEFRTPTSVAPLDN